MFPENPLWLLSLTINYSHLLLYQLKMKSPTFYSSTISGFLCCLLSTILNPISSAGQGSFILAPNRLVFEAGTESLDVTLTNTGKDSSFFLLSFKHFNMNENGSFIEMEENSQDCPAALPFLRYFPKSLKLAPGASQIIKIQLTNLDELGVGEYRSHLFVREAPEMKPLGDSPQQATPSTIGIVLDPVIGLAIPVIIRQGRLQVSSSLTNLSLIQKDMQSPKLALQINRSGTKSLYGDLQVTHSWPDGKSEVIGQIKGVGVYTPNSSRSIQIPLSDFKATKDQGHKLVVEYLKYDLEGKAKLICKNEFSL